MNDIVTMPQSMPVPAINPMTLLASALERNASVETIAQLMTLQERWDATQARRAFDEAIALAKAQISPAAKNKTGHNQKKYADFYAYAKVIDPIISQFGLSYRFRSKQDGKIVVTCILSHRMGHSEETTLEGPPDTTGNKNAIQAIGSTLTYLQRYSLVLSLGLAATEDDDGAAAGMGETITDIQVGDIERLIEETSSDLTGFLKYFKVADIKDLPAKEYKRAIAALEAKRAKK